MDIEKVWIDCKIGNLDFPTFPRDGMQIKFPVLRPGAYKYAPLISSSVAQTAKAHVDTFLRRHFSEDLTSARIKNIVTDIIPFCAWTYPQLSQEYDLPYQIYCYIMCLAVIIDDIFDDPDSQIYKMTMEKNSSTQLVNALNTCLDLENGIFSDLNCEKCPITEFEFVETEFAQKILSVEFGGLSMVGVIGVVSGIKLPPFLKSHPQLGHLMNLCEKICCVQNDVLGVWKDLMAKEEATSLIMYNVRNGKDICHAINEEVGRMSTDIDDYILVRQSLLESYRENVELVGFVSVMDNFIVGHMFAIAYAQRYSEDGVIELRQNGELIHKHRGQMILSQLMETRVAAGSENATRYPTRYPQYNYPYPHGYPLPATRYEN
ncbi:hypothetical protein Fcan01_17553 [Folsomia candida]|uniref:Terpene synthase n=1 Tax=Folsomia candida TaxID=158441 RepID=A0A226DQG9_FOLCA|nr:hypothetical protein Fcan01_17553 [Folsomia candida]